MKNLNRNNQKVKNNKANGSYIQKYFNKFWISINVTFLLIGFFPLLQNGDISVHFIPVIIGLNMLLAMMKMILVFLYGNDFEPEIKDENNSIQDSPKVIEPQPKYQIGDFVKIMFIDNGCYNESYCLQYFDKYLSDRAIHFKCNLNPKIGSLGKILTFFKDYHDEYLYFIELDIEWVVLMREECIRRINKEIYFESPNFDNKPNLRKNKINANPVVHHTTIIKKEDNSFSDFVTGAAIGAATNDLFHHRNSDIDDEIPNNFGSEQEHIDTILGSDSIIDNSFLDD